MSLHPQTNSSILELSQPAGNPDQPYYLPALSGEIIFIPCSNSATRLLVTGKETNNAFAVVGSGGTAAAPIGFHFHRETHDVFLCLKGQVNVWCGEKARTMSPGDFASVPPNTVHQYQFVGDYTEFIGLIVPGGWEEFFRFIGEPYVGPLFPLKDDRNPFEVLIPKLKAAAEQFDMVPVPHQKPFDPTPWDGTENKLPSAVEPYFLRAGSGPRYLLRGTLCRPLITTTQSGGKFTIASIEGSSHHGTPVFTEHLGIAFADAHHCFQVAQGKIKFTVAGKTAVLSEFETLFIPAGTEFRFTYASNFAKAYVFANGDGIAEVLMKLGTDYEPALIPEKEEEASEASFAKKLETLQKESSFEIV